VLDALQQRLTKYREAGIQARTSGDERKARMHERIAKVGLRLHSSLSCADLSGQLFSVSASPINPGFL
jgi:coiled-coil and C2 domain-containing protein 1